MSKTKFTKETRDGILKSLKRGDSMRTAASLNRVNHTQIYRWLKRGEDSPEGSVYRQFYDDLHEAMAEPLARANAIVQRDMLDNPKTAMWFLERRDKAFAPPGAAAPTIQTGPVLIQLSLADGSLPTLGSFGGEVIEDGEYSEAEPAQLPSA